MRRMLLPVLTVLAAILLISCGDSGEYKAVGSIHTNLCVPEKTIVFETDGEWLSYIELTTGDGFLVDMKLDEGVIYRLYRDDMGTPSMDDDVIISADKLL